MFPAELDIRSDNTGRPFSFFWKILDMQDEIIDQEFMRNVSFWGERVGFRTSTVIIAGKLNVH